MLLRCRTHAGEEVEEIDNDDWKDESE